MITTQQKKNDGVGTSPTTSPIRITLFIWLFLTRRTCSEPVQKVGWRQNMGN